MKILVKKVNEKPFVKEIKGDLSEMQEIVGGYIETFRIDENILCVCNEEGKLIGLEPNFICRNEEIVGDVFFAGIGYEDLISLTNDDIKRLMSAFLRYEEMNK